ncbi:Ig-like domain-containing domain [Myroides sp. LJL115]
MSKFRIYFSCISLVFITLFFANCAKRGSISGGPKDTLPPVLIHSIPKNYSTNFDQKEVRILFDEYIKVNNLNQYLIISPPMENMPDISPMGIPKKTLTIRFRDSLAPNTTYNINFGNAIADNNENNVFQQFKYVFSTGDYIDSLQLNGSISTAHQLKTDNFVNVMLYEAKTFTDSTVYKQKPLYVTNTLDSLTSFKLENLKEGYYKIIGLKDKNNDYLFNPSTDKIAFLTDSIYLPTDKKIDLVLFESIQEFAAKRPTQESENKWYLPYVGEIDDLSINVKKGDSLIKSTYTLLPKKDSLQVWFPQVKTDSLTMSVSKGEEVFTLRPKVKIKEIDSLQITGTSGLLHYGKNLQLSSTTPIEHIDLDKFTFIDQDSVAVSFTLDNKYLDQALVVNFEKQESTKYNLSLLPGAITDFFGEKNDTLSYSFYTGPYKDYGNLSISLSNVESFPIIVDLIDDKNNVLATKYSTGETTLDFDLLTPNTYIVRISYDTNRNGKWDTGDYLKQIQPEKSVFFPEPIMVRANWDLIQQIDL